VKSSTIGNPNAHASDAGPLDLDHDGRVSGPELLLVLLLGLPVIAAATALGALLVHRFCG
jgi:hypothetical protein